MEKILKHPVLVIVIIAVITVFFGLQLPKVELDNNNLRFLPDGNKAKIISDYIDDTFGGQVIILVGLERPYRTVFEKDFLTKIREFSDAVENVESVKSVNSIMSTQYITGIDDSIVVSDLVPEDFTGTKEEISELRRRIASWDLYQNSLVSEDLSATQILITLDVLMADSVSPEVSVCLHKIRALASDIFAGSAEVYFTGMPVINETINGSMISDNALLIPLVVLVVLAVLFFSFRRFTFVILPLLTVIIAVVWTMGTAALIGMKLSVLSTILPVILIAVGSAYGIHIVTHYAENIRNKTLSVDEHRIIVLDLVKRLTKPIFIAAITTMAGFISLCFTPIIPIREFGYCGTAGVFVALIVSLFFIPTILLIRGPRAAKTTKEKRNGRFGDAVVNFFLAIVRKKYLVLAMAVLVIGVSLYGLSKIVVDNVLIEYFQNETDMSKSDRFIREYFGGSKDVSLVIRAATTEELLHPDVLQAVSDLSAYLSTNVPAVGKVVGFTDIIKRVNQVFNASESPEGLRPVASDGTAGSGGFGDDFGFNDFGFDDFGFGNDFETVSELRFLPSDADEGSHYRLDRYTAADLLHLLDSASGVSSSLSGNGLVTELKRLTNYEGMAYYEIPSEPSRYAKETREDLQRLIANYLVLVAGDDNSDYSNDPLEPTAIRTMVQLRTTGNRDTMEVIDLINEYIKVNFPKNVEVMIGGGSTIEGAITDLIVQSSLLSIVLSIVTVFLLIAIFYKSPAAGIIGAVTLTMAVICNFAIMGFTGIKLNIATALMGSLTVGICIDYTLHFMESVKREYKSGKQDYLQLTFIDCGKAILINALSVGAGFGVLAFSQFRIIAELGIIVALSMLITAFISLTLIPVLITVFKPKFIYREKQQ